MDIDVKLAIPLSALKNHSKSNSKDMTIWRWKCSLIDNTVFTCIYTAVTATNWCIYDAKSK